MLVKDLSSQQPEPKVEAVYLMIEQTQIAHLE